MAQFKQAEIGREPGHAEPGERAFNRGKPGIDSIDASRAGHGRPQHRPLLPAEAHGLGDVSDLPRRVIGKDDFADPATLHDLPERDTFCVVARSTHAPAHVRIDGEPLGLDEDLAGAGIRHRLRIHGPIVRGWHALWITCEEPSAIHDVLHGCSSSLNTSDTHTTISASSAVAPCPLACTISGLTSISVSSGTVCISRPMAMTTRATASMSAGGAPRKPARTLAERSLRSASSAAPACAWT